MPLFSTLPSPPHTHLLQYLSDDRCKRLTCGACSVDVASTSSVVWEGVMGTQSMPAVLCDHTLNCEAYTLQRQER